MNILGIHKGHDSSICLLKNGRIEKYILTERFTRNKHDDNIAFDILINIIKYNKIDAIATNSIDIVYQLICNSTILDKCPAIHNYSNKHHISHAELAYNNSGFNTALVLSIDGFGSIVRDSDNPNEVLAEAESVYFYNRNYKTLIYKNLTRRLSPKDYLNHHSFPFIPDLNDTDYDFKNAIGIGQVYEIAAIVTNNTQLDCGKPMGLSSYGIYDEEFDGIYKKNNNLNNDFFFRKDINSFLLHEQATITKENYRKYSNFCYAVQNETQKAVGDLIEEYIQTVPTNNVCISGGYGMNVVANYYLLKRFPHLNFYFEPICNDNGISIGAAMHLYNELKSWYHPKIRSASSTFIHGMQYNIPNDGGSKVNIKDVAKYLYSNYSVGVFQGRAEAGQRALGNRSILFNALNHDAKEIINKIKNREWYRPFAAVVLQEDAHLYFDTKLMSSNPFMTVAFPVITNIVPGITHVDHTCRIQTVSKNDGYIYKLLKEFKKISGHGILLNTSLNLAGEPLAESPLDAFDVLKKTELDFLYFPEKGRIHTKEPGVP